MQEILKDLYNLKNEKKAVHLMRFFQCKEGGYAEFDKWLGITNPQVRQIVKKYKNVVTIADLKSLIKNEYHEVRLCALLLLIEIFNKADDIGKKEVVDFYLCHTKYINNWDLVDLSSYKIIGKYCYETKNYDILYNLAKSHDLWEQRISIVSNWWLVHNKKFDVFVDIAKSFLTTPQDLIQKAVGWILREMGKMGDEGYKKLIEFLDSFYLQMPRVMLRYSIERLSKELKQKYMEQKSGI